MVNESLTAHVNDLFRFDGQGCGMNTSRIGLFDLAEQRLAWAASRQNVLASNIANASTPGFKARDVQSFESLLSGLSPAAMLQPVRTSGMHLNGTVPAQAVPVIADTGGATSIDGNSVSLDQQLSKVADTETTESMVTTIWKKYMSFFSLALGRSS
jgi:flagellar basal-body rod protein FlgB